MSEEDPAKGLRAAADQLMRDATRAKAEGQLSLLPLAEGEIAEAVERRGPGRRPGSRNRSTEEWRDHILSRYRSPLEFLAATWSRPVELLAAELGCDRHDAMKVQVQAATAALPYLHRKQPQAIELEDGAALPTIVLVTPGQADRMAAGETLELLPVPDDETQENQGVADASGGQGTAAGSQEGTENGGNAED